MQQIKLISKLGLTLIAITAISAAVAMQAYYYYTQAADAQPPPEAFILPDNSVFSQTIIDGQVHTQDLADESVTTAKIRNGEVNTEDLASGAIVPNVQYAQPAAATFIEPGNTGYNRAECPPGTIIIGGGFSGGDWTNQLQVYSSQPFTGTQWRVEAFNGGFTSATLRAQAICMGPSP